MEALPVKAALAAGSPRATGLRSRRHQAPDLEARWRDGAIARLYDGSGAVIGRRATGDVASELTVAVALDGLIADEVARLARV